MDVDKDDSQISVSGNTVFISVPGKAARTIQSGEILGDNYELLDLLGKGGMGVVWRCRHLLMGHEYALKILSPHMVNEFSWKRFAIEGQVIAKLSHGNIVKIYNMGIYKDDCPFYVMELLSGLSLEEYVDKNGPLNNLETLTVALHLSEALAYAHAKGVIHRDLKPANIMLPENNAGNNRFSDVKIVDFGLAKLLGKQGHAGQSLTNAGDIFGSPLYMSPEQGMAGDIDVRSDIYSLGCTLFKLLTGEAPFYGANGFKTAMMHQKDPLPKLAEVAPQNDIASVWQTIIEKMTAKNPAMRYQTMEQLHHDLQRVKAGKDITAYGAEIARTNKKDWREAAPKAPTSAWWQSRAAVSTAVLATACGTIFAALNLSPKHRVIAPRAGPREISITSFALDPKIDADMPAADRHKIEAEYTAFQAKRSRISNVNGTRTALMYFPATSIGDVSNGRETVTAKNITQLQINKDGFDLILKASANRCTFDFPWILKKIDGSIFSSVNLDRASYNSAIGFVRDEGEKDLFDIDKIIEIVSIWPNLKRIDLDEFDLDGAGGAMLDEATNLAGLYLKKSHVNEEAFRGRKFVNRLKILYLHESQNVDAALKYLSPQSALKMVQLDSTKPSVESLKNLSHCSQLQRVGLEQVPMSEAHWQALGQFHHLDILSLRHVPIDKGRLESLGCLTPDTKLVISDNCVARSQVPALKHKFPNLAIFSERYSFGGSSMREIFIKGNHK